ncbi:unnamed protein product, partial [Effrenium voratum]
IAGTLSAVEAADPQVRAWVQDPGLAMKPREEWPTTVPKARINSTKEEWYKLCGILFERGIIEPIAYGDIFKVDNVPVLNGAFAVEKKGKAAPGECRVTRLIMNMIPGNSYQKLMAGDLSTLASSTGWCSLILRQQDVLLWSSEDQRGAFYAWKLPPAWKPLMSFRWPVPGSALGLQCRWTYVAATVVPMGWINAVSLFQHLHRQVGMAPSPKGAGHPAEIEWRRDRPIPFDSQGTARHFVQFYLDDFDAPELIPSEGWESQRGTVGPLHEVQRQAYKRWGIGIAEDKAQVREPRVIRMGAEINGILGRISAPKQKKMEVAWYGLELLGNRWPTVKARLMVLGRLVRCFEFRRPLMSLLHEIWPRGPVHQRQRLSAKGMFEVLQSIALLPLAGTDLRAQVDPVATCSDASESGGGLCASGALTQEGKNLLKHLQSPEVDVECKRLVRRRWPGVIELGDIKGVSRATIGRRRAQWLDGQQMIIVFKFINMRKLSLCKQGRSYALRR